MSEPTNSQATQEMLLAGVGAAANRLAQRSEELVKQLRWSKWQRVFALSSIVFMIILLVIQVFLALNNTAVNNRVKDCTIPSGTCYQRSQQQTGKAIEEIISVQLAQTWCSKNAKTYDQLVSCVVRLTGHTPASGGTNGNTQSP